MYSSLVSHDVSVAGCLGYDVLAAYCARYVMKKVKLQLLVV
jgi:hypothetical protein